MKPQQFLILAVATVVAFIAAAVVHARRQPWTEARPAVTRFAPTLARDAAKVARIEIRQAETAFTFERKGEAWTLKERADYPVKGEAVLGVLSRLAQSDLVEPKTRSTNSHAMLELEDPAAKGAKSRQVRLLDEKGAIIADVVVGKRRLDAFGPSKGGTYVRKTADPQTWLATGDIDVPTEVRGWVAANVIDLPVDKVSKVTIELPGEAPLLIEREAAGKYKLASAPAGRKLKEGNAVDETARAATSIELDDLRKAPATPVAADKTSTVRVTSEGGPEVVLRFTRDGGADWMTVTASGATGDAKTAADAINARTAGWEYKVPAAKAGALLKRIADFLEAG